MFRFLPTKAVFLAVALLGLGLSGCFDNEPQEREAFKKFLQTRIIDKPGLHVPKLTAEEKKALGRYSEHYEIINRFYDRMGSDITKPMVDAVKAGSFRTVSEMMNRQADLLKVQEAAKRLRASLDGALTDVEAEKNRLAQPEDLKAVYLQAFERDVTRPAEALRAAFPAMEENLDAAVELTRFLEKNQGKWKAVGLTVEFDDQKLLDQFNKLAAALSSKSRNALEQQRNLRKLISG